MKIKTLADLPNKRYFENRFPAIFNANGLGSPDSFEVVPGENPVLLLRYSNIDQPGVYAQHHVEFLNRMGFKATDTDPSGDESHPIAIDLCDSAEVIRVTEKAFQATSEFQRERSAAGFKAQCLRA